MNTSVDHTEAASLRDVAAHARASWHTPDHVRIRDTTPERIGVLLVCSVRLYREGLSYTLAQRAAAGALNHQLSRLINSGVRNDGLLNLYSGLFLYSCT